MDALDPATLMARNEQLCTDSATMLRRMTIKALILHDAERNAAVHRPPPLTVQSFYYTSADVIYAIVHVPAVQRVQR